MKRLLLLSLALVIFVAGCDTVSDIIDDDPEPVTTGIIVAAQGAFGNDDGGVKLYRLDGTVAASYDGLYVQSAALYNDDLFITTNSRIDILNPETLARTGQISSTPNPRYFAFDGSNAWVTNLYTDATTFGEGAVTAINLSNNSFGTTTIIGGNPEGIVKIGNRLYVANHDWGSGTTITLLDAATLEEVGRWDDVCDGPRFLFEDAGRVVAACTGASWAGTGGAFVVLNADTGVAISRVEVASIGTASSGTDAVYVEDSRTIYAVDDTNKNVYVFDAANGSLSATLSVPGNHINAVAYDVNRDYLLLARLNPDSPFSAQGALQIYTADGTLVDTFNNAGIAPTEIVILSDIAEG